MRQYNQYLIRPACLPRPFAILGKAFNDKHLREIKMAEQEDAGLPSPHEQIKTTIYTNTYKIDN